MVAVVDYNAGNLYSVIHALKRLNTEAVVTSDPRILQQAGKVILPGQGDASQTMQSLRNLGLDRLLIELKQPVLGICVGMQLMCTHSEEGNTDCLGIFDVPVLKFNPKQQEDKVPHMGWNTLTDLKLPLYKGVGKDDFVYFVHSYYVPSCEQTIAGVDYIQPFSASLRKDNFYAVQFHPEKSGQIGERILHNFLIIK